MSILNEYAEFKARLDVAVLSSLENDVAPALIGGILASVSVNVYNAYDPTRYIRRYSSGGLMDIKNYKTGINAYGNLYQLTITNETTGNPRYSTSKDGWDPGYITDIIETGVGYHWKHSEIYQSEPYPRPFMEEAFDFATNLDDLLYAGLASRGFTE